MNVLQMRNEIAGLYDSVKWKRRVREMPEHQVIAIYNKTLYSGGFERAERRKENERKYHQMTLFECGL